MNLPKLTKNDHNFVCIDLGYANLWFSYATLIAFQMMGENVVVHENVWSNTTGKHLNRIDGGKKENRYNSKDFNDLWKEQTKDLMVSGLFA